MPRHRGQFKPDRSEPYEISRGKVENFIKCRACFWLDRVGGVHFPSIPGFNINSNTDNIEKLSDKKRNLCRKNYLDYGIDSINIKNKFDCYNNQVKSVKDELFATVNDEDPYCRYIEKVNLLRNLYNELYKYIEDCHIISTELYRLAMDYDKIVIRSSPFLKNLMTACSIAKELNVFEVEVDSLLIET